MKHLLTKGVDVNYKDRVGKTALMHASYNDHKEIVELLLNNGADVTYSDDYI